MKRQEWFAKKMAMMKDLKVVLIVIECSIVVRREIDLVNKLLLAVVWLSNRVMGYRVCQLILPITNLGN